MSTLTTNYGFIKPQRSDAADIEATNPNWDKLDAGLKTMNTAIDALEIEFERKITYGYSSPSDGSHGDIYIQLIE